MNLRGFALTGHAATHVLASSGANDHDVARGMATPEHGA